MRILLFMFDQTFSSFLTLDTLLILPGDPLTADIHSWTLVINLTTWKLVINQTTWTLVINLTSLTLVCIVWFGFLLRAVELIVIVLPCLCFLFSVVSTGVTVDSATAPYFFTVN